MLGGGQEQIDLPADIGAIAGGEWRGVVASGAAETVGSDRKQPELYRTCKVVSEGNYRAVEGFPVFLLPDHGRSLGGALQLQR